MAGTYVDLHYHLVWATKDRLPRLTSILEPHVYGHIRGKCAELGAYVHALDGAEDHTHLVCSLPPTVSIADFLHRIKGASSHFVNRLEGTEGSFWQPGYGALTVSRRDLPRVVAYVQDQKQHHVEGTLSAAMERTDDA